jgi:hypothetical protein
MHGHLHLYDRMLQVAVVLVSILLPCQVHPQSYVALSESLVVVANLREESLDYFSSKTLHKQQNPSSLTSIPRYSIFKPYKTWHFLHRVMILRLKFPCYHYHHNMPHFGAEHISSYSF